MENLKFRFSEKLPLSSGKSVQYIVFMDAGTLEVALF